MMDGHTSSIHPDLDPERRLRRCCWAGWTFPAAKMLQICCKLLLQHDQQIPMLILEDGIRMLPVAVCRLGHPPGRAFSVRKRAR